MTNESIGTPVQRLSAFNNFYLGEKESNCVDTNYNDLIQDLKQISLTSDDANGNRQWFYQCCTEFGYFQTSTSHRTLFGNQITLNYNEMQCTEVLGNKSVLTMPELIEIIKIELIFFFIALTYSKLIMQ